MDNYNSECMTEIMASFNISFVIYLHVPEVTPLISQFRI